MIKTIIYKRMNILRFLGMTAVWLCVAAVQTAARPHLLYTEQSIARARHNIKTDTLYAKAWAELKRDADTAARRRDLKKLDVMALAWYMTDSVKYADAIRGALLNTAGAETWGSPEMLSRKPVWRADLGVAHKAYQAAIGYDAVRDRLSAADRKTISRSLYRLALEPLLGDWLLDGTRIHSLNSMGHNWWTSCACMGGLLALSLRDDFPESGRWIELMNEAVPQWFGFAGDVLQHKPKTFDEAGGMYESVNYANFGISEALLYCIAARNVDRGDLVPQIPELKNVATFFVSVCYPNSGQMRSINFGDSHQNIVASNSIVALYELGIKDNDMLWYLSRLTQNQDRDGAWLNRPIGFLYTPDLSKAPAVPSCGMSRLFADHGWATMRTSWEPDATMLAVKSGYTWNHSHADANSFVLFHKGVDVLKEAGHCWYPNENYRKYFFQSRAHNVVLFDGEGQPTAQQYQGAPLRGHLHYLMDHGSMRYILADGTGPYSDNFSRNFRHFLWMDNVIYVIDDLKTHRQGEFEWLWHYNGEAKKNGADFTFTSGESSVVVRPLYPRLLALSDFVHDYPEDLYWEAVEAPTEDLKTTETYYSFHLPGKTDRVKAVSAIILKDTPGQKELPQMERREGKDWIGLRVRWQGRVTDIYINQLADGRLMHSNSWIEADGWTTDAYMFAVTYDEGAAPETADRRFICYGSVLRRGAKCHFASQAKLYVMQHWDKQALHLTIEGQPRGVAYFGGMTKPSKVVLGRSHTASFDNGTLRIKY